MAAKILRPLARKLRSWLNIGKLYGNQKQAATGKELGPEFYDDSFTQNEHWRDHYTESRYYPNWLLISDRMKRSEVKSIVDIGCGSGQFAQLLYDQGFPAYVGVDFSSKRIDWARKICPAYTFVAANIFEIDLLETHFYDAVVCTEFLEHVEEDLRVIENIRPGSRVYATVPNFPYKSHVRHFSNIDEVIGRYKELFDPLRVDQFAGDAKGKLYFLIEGTRRAR